MVGDVGRAYPAVQNVAYDFARDHWKEVEKSEGMKTLVEMLEREDLPARIESLLFRLGIDGRRAAAEGENCALERKGWGH